MKNKYMFHSRIFEKKFMEILKYFALDLEAKKIAQLCQISQQSLCKIFKQIRILIAKECVASVGVVLWKIRLCFCFVLITHSSAKIYAKTKLLCLNAGSSSTAR